MALRNSMSGLILLVRDKIADPDGATFTDDQIQDALDRYRVDQRRIPLHAIASYPAGTQAEFLDYYADSDFWESDYLLQDAAYNTITASLFEGANGHWQFAAQPNGVSVHVTGKTYDIYAASADLLETLAAQKMLQFSFTTGRDQFNRQQMYDNIMALAQRYRQQAQPTVTIASTGDDEPWLGDNAVVYPTSGGSW